MKGNIKVHGGDFNRKTGFLGTGLRGSDYLCFYTGRGGWRKEKISFKEIELVQVASEESVKRFSGTVGFGLVGGVLLGPIGALAGLLAGGRKKEVTFIAQFKDGRKLLATTDNETFLKIQAACF